MLSVLINIQKGAHDGNKMGESKLRSVCKWYKRDKMGKKEDNECVL